MGLKSDCGEICCVEVLRLFVGGCEAKYVFSVTT